MVRDDGRFGKAYVVRNNITGRLYVGQTVERIEKRIQRHRIHPRCLIGRAIRKYDMEHFDVFTFDGLPPHLMDFMEIALIARFDCHAPKGYNLTLGGMYNHGGLSASHRARIGAKSKGRRLSDEAKRKISEANKGNPSHMRGKHHIQETKAKIAAAHVGLRPWNKGIPMSEQTKRKAIAKLKGRVAPNKRSVLCIDTGEVFDSVRLAAKKYGIHESNLATVARGNWITCGGYRWTYEIPESAKAGHMNLEEDR